MRRLPRVFAVTTDSICRAPDFPEKVAALGALGPDLGIVIRAPRMSAGEYASLLTHVSATGRRGGAALFGHGRPDLAAACDADGLQLRRNDLPPREARTVFPGGWIGVSVHGREEAEGAVADGADFVMVGSVFESGSHPGRPGHGIDWLREFTGLGSAIVAIGGVTRERVPAVRRAGASAVAVISAIWDQPDPVGAADAMLQAWEESVESIRLTVNGEPRMVGGPATLERLLQELELDARAVVVELNRRIVRRPELGHTRLQNGDAVELVHFVGGG